MNNFNKFITILLIISVAFVGCSNTVKSQKEEVINLNANNNDSVYIQRFDKQVYDYLLNPSVDKQNSLIAQYPDLLQALSLSVANAGMETDSTQVFDVISKYFSHPMLMQLYKDALTETDLNVNNYESQLTKAKGLSNKYLPKYQMPQFAMHVSGFKENVIVLDEVISLSAERYLGNNYELYPRFFESYQIQQMAPEFVTRDYLTAWLMSSVILQSGTEKPTLLSAMIDEGKTKYILSLLLPDNNEENIMGYTEQQMTWCENNEKEVWKNILKHNQLFTTDYLTISKYIHDAPYTMPVGKDSPGRMGAWIGWQIVNEYMKKTNASIDQLLHTDAKEILKISKYNPS